MKIEKTEHEKLIDALDLLQCVKTNLRQIIRISEFPEGDINKIVSNQIKIMANNLISQINKTV